MSREHPAFGLRLVGRDRELEQVERFMTADSARGLLIRGAAGIGKTALWRAALDRARAAGHLVLVARPAEEELQASMVGLLDLFEGVDTAVAEPAVLDPETELFDRGRAVLRTLRRLTDACPVVLAIDDLQWIDPISGRSLRYALRRLEDRPVLVLATERTASTESPVELLNRDRWEEITLGALSIEEIRKVLSPVVATIPRPALELVHELSSGNPLYAIELARSTDLSRGRLAALPRRSLDIALSARLAATPAEVREIVEIAAALGPASPESLQAACGAPDARDRLVLAIDGGLLSLDDSMLVRCAHPLLATAALAAMEPPARRALHARLADGASDPDDRARHLALATVARDERCAADLEEAAHRAGRRGAPALAAEFAAHSLRLTPVDDRASLARRAVAEILHRAAAGETGRAIAMVDAIVAGLPPGPERFAALALRVGLDFGHAEEVLVEAREEADTDELIRGRILDLLAYMSYMYRGELARARELAAEALTVAESHGDTELEMTSSATLSTAALLAGDPEPGLLDRALELAPRVSSARLGRWPAVERARQCLWAGRLQEAREVFEQLRAMTARSGIEFQRPYRLVDLAFVELAAGNLALAAELAGDGLESALDAGNTSIAVWLWYPAGLAHAHLGDDEQASLAVAEMRSWGIEHDELPRLLMAHHVAGVLALARGKAESALGEFLDGVTLGRRAGHAHPGVIPVLPDAIEAAIAIGKADVAAELAVELDSQAAALRFPWVDAAALRGRGLAATAAGDRHAPAMLAESGTAFDGIGYRMDAARVWLWHGRALHRAGRRGPAAEALADARDRFRTLGARPWVEQAEADLERVAPGRTTGSLTEDEVRIATLVSEGRRNREIAAELFVSVATVEAHLTRMYRKMGVRSRTELSRRLLESQR